MSQAAVHPCFNQAASHQHGRIHLPVAAKCNIQCNYCNRKTDCPNESRPGVTSTLLTPPQALEFLRRSVAHDPRISVAAIAGPGDAFANPEETLATLRGVRDMFPELVTCLSSNGLNIAPYIAELDDLGVKFVTLTINAIDPEILAKVYAWARFNGKTYRGMDAAKLMLERQMDALEELKRRNFTVKVNSVVLPGINDHHIPELARHLSAFKIDRMNCIPVIANENSFFEDVSIPDTEMMERIKKGASMYVPLMTHCNRCRSDAAGLLGQEDPEFQTILRDVSTTRSGNGERPVVAVATQEGIFVNLHLGEADRLTVFSHSGENYRILGERETAMRGLGDARWENLAESLADVDILLVSGIGPRPLEILTAKGLKVLEVKGFIDDHLQTFARGELPKVEKSREDFSCGSECKGSGTGCMS
jgi:nitrogen fixation protein NifB